MGILTVRSEKLTICNNYKFVLLVQKCNLFVRIVSIVMIVNNVKSVNLVDLVYLVDFVCLVYLVCLVCFVDLVYLVCVVDPPGSHLHLSFMGKRL